MKKLPKSAAYKRIATTCFILFLIAAVLLIARALLIDYIADTPRMIMSDEEYEEMLHFFSNPVQIDESVYEVEPYPADLIEDASRFQKLLQMNERSLLNLLSENGILKAYVSLRKEIPYSNENINAIQAIQQKYEHIFVAAHQMVDHPEYDLLVLTKCGSPSIDIINNNLELFHNTTLVLKLSASLQSSEKDWENAFDTYNILLNVCKHSAYTPVNLQKIMNRNIITTLQLIVSSSNDCENIFLLEKALQKMAQLEPYMFHETLREPFLTDIVAALRVRKHLNYAVKFEKGMYGWELFEQYRYFRITIFMSDDWQQLSPEQFREKLRNNKKIDGHWTNESIWEFAKKCYKMRKAKENGYVLPAFFLCRYMVTSNNMRFLKPSAEFQYMDFFDEYNSIPSIMLRQKNLFHLTQITLAQRIAQLKGETVPGQKPELVPEYFESELIDPFSGEPYLWDSENECFYGVGPDKEDDQNSLTYDPTNGVISAGDISLPR